MSSWLSVLTHLASLSTRVQNVLDALVRIEQRLEGIAHELGTLDDMEDDPASDEE